ncbi:hypothetical protein [Bifidobacterium sp. ESL0825]|uniref:hypothetical protein n=1 Tax=Bifidobacterium sp. ESL0825 TaxID=3448587 RepID=UPI00404367A0
MTGEKQENCEFTATAVRGRRGIVDITIVEAEVGGEPRNAGHAHMDSTSDL